MRACDVNVCVCVRACVCACALQRVCACVRVHAYVRVRARVRAHVQGHVATLRKCLQRLQMIVDVCIYLKRSRTSIDIPRQSLMFIKVQRFSLTNIGICLSCMDVHLRNKQNNGTGKPAVAAGYQAAEERKPRPIFSQVGLQGLECLGHVIAEPATILCPP